MPLAMHGLITVEKPRKTKTKYLASLLKEELNAHQYKVFDKQLKATETHLFFISVFFPQLILKRVFFLLRVTYLLSVLTR